MVAVGGRGGGGGGGGGVLSLTPSPLYPSPPPLTLLAGKAPRRKFEIDWPKGLTRTFSTTMDVSHDWRWWWGGGGCRGTHWGTGIGEPGCGGGGGRRRRTHSQLDLHHAVTPLVLATLRNDRDQIRLLLENGACVDFRSRCGSFQVIGSGSGGSGGQQQQHQQHHHHHQQYTSGTSPNPLGSTWLTPIHVAAAEGKLIALQTLMYYGASPNARDSLGFNALFHACARGHAELARWILIWAGHSGGHTSGGGDSGAGGAGSGAGGHNENPWAMDLEERDGNGRTAFYHACYSGNATLLQLLLDHGISHQVQSNAGNNALMALCCAKPRLSGGAGGVGGGVKGGNAQEGGEDDVETASAIECARLLLERGVAKDGGDRAASADGNTAVQLALLSGNARLAHFIQQWTPVTAAATGTAATTTTTTTTTTAKSTEQLLANARAQWQSIKKMLALGGSSMSSSSQASLVSSRVGHTCTDGGGSQHQQRRQPSPQAAAAEPEAPAPAPASEDYLKTLVRPTAGVRGGVSETMTGEAAWLNQRESADVIANATSSPAPSPPPPPPPLATWMYPLQVVGLGSSLSSSSSSSSSSSLGADFFASLLSSHGDHHNPDHWRADVHRLVERIQVERGRVQAELDRIHGYQQRRLASVLTAQ